MGTDVWEVLSKFHNEVEEILEGEDGETVVTVARTNGLMGRTGVGVLIRSLTRSLGALAQTAPNQSCRWSVAALAAIALRGGCRTDIAAVRPRRSGGARWLRRAEVRPSVGQAAASRCWWSLSRLCVAVRRRHSDLTADLPRRKKRLAPRFDLICPKTGSTVPWRLR